MKKDNQEPKVKLELSYSPPSTENEKRPRIVFTNGCFDLLHPGHLFLLRKAKELGDILIIGLDSDESVRALNKRPKRPINDEETRSEVLKAIRWVDQVIIFTGNEGLLSLVKQIKPDVMVKGGDYQENDIVGASFVKSYGGQVVVLPYLEGKSTTKLIQQIRNL